MRYRYKNMKKIILFVAAALLGGAISSAKSVPSEGQKQTPVESKGQKKPLLEPEGTYLFAERDSLQLFMDIYGVPEGVPRNFDSGKEKPSILFVFGGGFKDGSRDHPFYNRWFREMSSRGFKVISIDYRLGMKGRQTKGLIDQADAIRHSLDLAVEDLFSATEFIISNAEELGIDPYNLVLCGSSAGAMTVLTAEFEICNSHKRAAVLPKGFDYAGVMSFAGAILGYDGAIRYAREPAPTLLMHGTGDKIVNYKGIRLFKRNFCGSSNLARIYSRKGWNYCIYRFKGKGHEISTSMLTNINETVDFLQRNVSEKQKRVIDATVEDPSVRSSGAKSRKELYSE